MRRIQTVALALGLCVLPLAMADDCAGFKWDVSRERALFATAPQAMQAGADAEHAPRIEPGRLYALKLAPQEQLRLAVPPAKKTLDDGAMAGLVRVRVPAAGRHRVVLDRGFWVEAVADGAAQPSLDFSGSPGCTAPRKIVVYALPAGEVLLQLSGQVDAEVRLSLIAETP